MRPPMTKRFFPLLLVLSLWIVSGFTQRASAQATPTPSPTAAPNYTVIIDSITTSFGLKVVSPTARFGHTIGGNGAADSEMITVKYHLSGILPNQTSAERIAEVDLIEDNVKVAFDVPPLSGSLTYSPAVPGLRTLAVVSVQGNGTEVRSNGIAVQMFGVSLQTALGGTVTTPFLPFTSPIFLEANALLSDANIREAQF